MTKAKRAVFLDRDNTIIKNDGDLGDPDEVKLVRGAAHVIASLRQLGFQIVVVTNQGGVARGNYTERDVDAVHQRIANLVRESSGGLIDRFYYCPFHPDGNVPEYTREHPWRKPSPGMLLQAAKDLDLTLSECWMVGDAERDIQAGRRAECKTILITRHPNSVRTAADFRAETLAEAAAIVAQNRTRPKTSPRPIKVGAAVAAAEAASRTEPPVVETTGASRLVPSTTERAMDPQSVPGQSKLVSKMHPRLDDVATTLDDTTAGEIEFNVESEDATEALSSPVISDSQAAELLARTRDAATVDVEADDIDVEDSLKVDDEEDEATEVDDVADDDTDDEDDTEDEDEDEDEDEYEYEYEYEYEEEDADDDADSSAVAAASVATPQERVRHLAPAETDPRVFRAINDLASEIRAWRLGTPEFTPARMMVQLVLIGILLLAMAIAIYVDDRTDALIWVGVTLIGQLTLIGLLNVNRR